MISTALRRFCWRTIRLLLWAFCDAIGLTCIALRCSRGRVACPANLSTLAGWTTTTTRRNSIGTKRRITTLPPEKTLFIVHNDKLAMTGLVVQAEAHGANASCPEASRCSQSRYAKCPKAIRMHCPFYQHDPQYIGHSKSCTGLGFEDPCRLKEHLKKIHYKNRGSNAQISNNTSTRSTRPNPEQLSEIQYDTIRQLGRSSRYNTHLDIWQNIYRIIFPDDPIVPPAFKPTPQDLLAAAEDPSELLVSALVARMGGTGDLQPPSLTPEASARAFLAHYKHFAAEIGENGATYVSSASRGLKLPEAARPLAEQDDWTASATMSLNHNTSTPCRKSGSPQHLVEYPFHGDTTLYSNSADHTAEWANAFGIDESGDQTMFQAYA